MIKTLKISNFRSIKESSLELAPLTFLYGNNAAGKSSVFYSLNSFRNAIINPNQPVDSFFNLGFANLGGFKQVVFRHDESQPISISSTAKVDGITFTYRLTLKVGGGDFFLEIGRPYFLKLNLPVTFPYPLNASVQQELEIDGVKYKISWNGITTQVTPEPVSEETNKKARDISTIINKTGEIIRSVDIVPLKRGFTKPHYGNVSFGNFPMNEDEVASKLAADEYLDSKVSSYLEQIMDRQFRAKPQPGTSLISLTTTERESKQITDIVNDGFGVNQIVYLLAKTLNRFSEVICIEEPEINLHPGVIRRLPDIFIELYKAEGKQLIISTHSEALIIAMLSAISKGEVKSEDVAYYLLTKEGGVTSFKKQNITKDGQVEGGLTSFMEGELEDIKGFFKGLENKHSKENPDISL